MNFNALGSTASLSAYASAQLAKATGSDTSTKTASNQTGTTKTTQTHAQAALQNAAAQALSASAHSFRSSTAQAALEKKEQSLASDLRAAMDKAGVKLSGTVEFSVDSKGQLAVDGSDADKAAVTKFLAADRSKPGFSSRVASLAKDADSLSTTIRQGAAISQAAKYAGRAGNLMSLYGALLQQQDASPAVFSLSSSASSLSYPGVLAGKA